MILEDCTILQTCQHGFALRFRDHYDVMRVQHYTLLAMQFASQYNILLSLALYLLFVVISAVVFLGKYVMCSE